jgi:site-specific DNA recombinase
MSNPEKNSGEVELQNDAVKYSTNHYQVEEVHLQKKYGVYVRTNGNLQSESHQIEAAKKWLLANGILISEVEFFSEHAPANKVEVRPQLQRLLNAVKSGQITCVLTFSRCRLARSFYEYSKIVEIFYAKDIDVFFTGNETPFGKNHLIEGIYGIQTLIESKSIQAKIRPLHEMNLLNKNE